MSKKQHGLGERVADAARHVVDSLEQDVESLALTTPAEAIAEAAAAAKTPAADKPDTTPSPQHPKRHADRHRNTHHS